MHNQESQRRQYGLADRARQLGWTRVEVIDDDLGRSAGGINRPGFEHLLAAICEGRVGAVLALEVSRLSRNGRDWVPTNPQNSIRVSSRERTGRF